MPRSNLPERVWRRHLPRAVAFASVAVALLLVMVGAMVVMGARNSQLEQELAQAQTQKSDAQRQLMAAPIEHNPSVITDFVASAAAPDAQGRLFVDHDTNSIMILAINLPEPANGQHYVVWLQFTGAPEYARVGDLTLDDQNKAQLKYQPYDSLSRYDEVVITVETSTDGSMPEGPQLMTAGMVPQQ